MQVIVRLQTSAGPEPLDTKPFDTKDKTTMAQIASMVGTMFLEGENLLTVSLVNVSNGEKIRQVTVGDHDPVLFRAMHE